VDPLDHVERHRLRLALFASGKASPHRRIASDQTVFDRRAEKLTEMLVNDRDSTCGTAGQTLKPGSTPRPKAGVVLSDLYDPPHVTEPLDELAANLEAHGLTYLLDELLAKPLLGHPKFADARRRCRILWLEAELSLLRDQCRVTA
jgi:hypothetical protein